MPCEPRGRNRTCNTPGQTGPLSRWRTRNSSDPGWTRTTDRLLVGELPSPLGHRTVLVLLWPFDLRRRPTASGSRGTRTHNGLTPARCFQDRLLIQPVDFRESSCGSWTRTSITAFRAPRPAIERSRKDVTFQYCECRNRTRVNVVQSHVCQPADNSQCFSPCPFRRFAVEQPQEEGRAGLEPARCRLTGDRSAAELPTHLSLSLIHI